MACGEVYGHSGGIAGYGTVSFHSVDGSRQLSLGTTVYRGDPNQPLVKLTDQAMCG